MAAALAIGAFGALIGSFLNVVVYRVPRGRSIVTPPSACGACGHAVRAYDNIPLVSWLVLRGKCRDCAAPISARYPFVELGAAVFFAVIAWHFVGFVGTADDVTTLVGAAAQLVAYLYFGAVTIALALIDLDVHRLPNAIVVPSYLVVGALLTTSAILTSAWSPLIMAGIGFASLGGLYLVLATVRPGAMGLGDVKAAALAGAMLGWLGVEELLVGAFAGIILGGLFAVGLLLAGHGRRSAIAFGPWLLGGAWVGILAGEPIARTYLSLFGIT